MEKLSSKKSINFLAFIFATVYMVSYITRINFGAIIVEIESATKLSRSLLSLSLTGSSVTYGVGQIISGVIGDRISPKKLMTIGFIITVSVNTVMPFCHGAYQMALLWCVNGFAQSLMWPPMVRIMTTLLSKEDYKTVVTKVSWGSNLGTIAVYLISPLLISFLGWKSVFWASAVCGFIMIFVWNKYSYEIPVVKSKTENSVSTSKKYALFTPIMICVFAAIALQGMLRDGITTWMPSYISDTYKLGNAISIFTGVLLPVFSIFCFKVASWVYINKIKNPLACAGTFFAAGACSAMGLVVFTGKSAILSTLFSATFEGCMHAVNLMLICMIPPFFEKSGKVSTVSGVLNSFTYVGSAISTYGIALLSVKLGWNFTILIWLLIAVIGMVLCFTIRKPFEKRFDISL